MARTRRADGTIGHPYSALNLRLVLALFGVVSMLVIAVVAFAMDAAPIVFLALAFAVLAAVNAIAVQRRRVQRHRREPDEHHSLFE